MPSLCKHQDPQGITEDVLSWLLLVFSKEVDGVAFEVDCAMVTIKDGDVDIGALKMSVI